jgi:hypothetical protein
MAEENKNASFTVCVVIVVYHCGAFEVYTCTSFGAMDDRHLDPSSSMDSFDVDLLFVSREGGYLVGLLV